MATQDYRWNQHEAAAAYDAAAPLIHPRYDEVQAAVLAALSFDASASLGVLDLGGGSGRLAERILSAFPGVHVRVLDQSQPFLSLAKERLAPFGGRAAFLHRRLQDDWLGGVGPVSAIVSTSAIHHLLPEEKQALFRRCFQALNSGGVFINGDEYRPQSDEQYRGLLLQWSRHMDASLASGGIPGSFESVLQQWKRRNIEEFGSPRKSGDDCLETIDVQTRYLRDAGFTAVKVLWRQDLWAVLVANKA